MKNMFDDIKKGVKVFCQSFQSKGHWVPKVEHFQLDKNPRIKDSILMWGWGRESGMNPDNYSWVVYDPAFPNIVRVSWKRGNYWSERDIEIPSGKEIAYGFDDDGPIRSIIRLKFWPEDVIEELK